MVRSLKFFGVYLFIFIFVVAAKAQIDSEITSKQTDLKKIKNEISSLEKEILDKSKKEKETFQVIQNYDKQNFLLNKIIFRYQAEEQQKQLQITSTEERIKLLTKEIFRLQENYSKYVKSVYRKGKRNELAFIFNSESITQALRRLFYFKKFSHRRENDLKELEANKSKLITARSTLQKEKLEKSLLLSKKKDEEKILDSKIAERKKVLTAVRKDKSELKKEIDVKKKAEITIRNIIAKLNEDKAKREKELKEKLRLAEENKIKKEKKNLTSKTIVGENKPEDSAILKNLSSFVKLKGKLSWPVSNGKIIRKFGENKNLILNTVTLNYGVDIKLVSDLNVRAVLNGVVSAIEWIPGYGSILIITHSDDYRTVYSHLDKISVNEGDIVNTGQTIATVGESIEGNILHFEIWNSRTNQNPEIWLAKK